MYKIAVIGDYDSIYGFAGTQTTSYLPLPMSVYYASIPSAGAAMLY